MNNARHLRLSVLAYMAEQERLGNSVAEAEAMAVIQERIRRSEAMDRFVEEHPGVTQAPETISDLGCNQ